MSSLRIRYQTFEFGTVETDITDIHVRMLRDRSQFADDDGVAEQLGISSALWPLFGVVWDSSQVLAHFLYDFDVAGKRILEVGCGIGLTSLVLNRRCADITATDYHPEAETFLRENTQLNCDRAIPFVRTSWADQNQTLGRFDLIVGSDLLYERNHAELLSSFIDDHAHPTCEVIVVDPGRKHRARFSRCMVDLGYAQYQHQPDPTPYLAEPFPGKIWHYQRDAE